MDQPQPEASSSSSSSSPPGLSSSSPVASSSTSSPVGPSIGGAQYFVPSPRRIVPTTPKKSILKKPPPPPRSFFSLGALSSSLPGPLSRFIPASGSSSGSSSGTGFLASPSAHTTSFAAPPSSPIRLDHGNTLLPSAVPYDDDTSNVKSTDSAIDSKSGAFSSYSNGSTSGSTAPTNPTLRRAHFILPHMSTVYPISSGAPPSSSELTIARAEIDARTNAQREKEKEEGAGAWSLGRIEDFYRECCRLREEQVLGGVVGALRQANIIAPRTLDLTAVKLTVFSAAALADALAIEWGLRKLILRDCDLDDTALKLILHALLIPSSLASLSLSSNKRMKHGAFKLISAYISTADTLEFIDLSQNVLEKRSVEQIVQAIQLAPLSDGRSDSPTATGFNYPGSPLQSPIYTSISSPSTYFPPLLSELANKSTDSRPQFGEKLRVPLLSLRLDECGLKGGALDVLAHAIRPSAIQNLSLRGNKMGPPGAVALALMIRDYPDSVPVVSTPSPSLSSFSIHPPSGAGTPTQLAFNSAPHARTSFATSSSISPSSSASNIRSSLSALGSSIGAVGGSTRRGSSSGATTPSTLPSPPATPPPRSLSLTIPENGTPLIDPSPSKSSGPLPPPPRHPGALNPHFSSTTPTQSQQPVLATTYTPYIPRSKRNLMAANVPTSPPPTQSPPIFQSSRSGGVTARVASPPAIQTSGSPAPYVPRGSARPGNAGGRQGLEARLASVSGRNVAGSAAGTVVVGGQQPGVLDGHSAALLDNIRSLDHLPRLGSLTTLDLRGNDLRNGVQYIAQVLKRNRTLKILSLADNRIEVAGFVQIAEALKYNSTLETLDMSQNPCCGPSLEGITAIRTAFTINTSLKRLYLSSSGLTSAGAIALAEFLPDARCLLHLDLTHNRLDLAGVLALSAGLKVNQVMRCLDVNVPPNDPEMARLSREILRCCVRNTEMIANPKAPSDVDEGKGASSLSMSEDLDLLFGAGTRGGVWGLIERSELARGVKQDVERERVGLERQAMREPDGKIKMDIWRKSPEEVMKIARDVLKEAQSPPELVDSEMLLSRCQTLVASVAETVQIEKDPSRLEELLELSDRLNGLIKDLKSGRAPYGAERPGAVRRNSKGKEKAPEPANLDFSPSAFSIAGSDDEDEASGPSSRGPIPQSPPSPENITSTLENLPAGELQEEPQATTLSKSWVEEEGEVFRKGTVLLGPEGLGEEGADLNSEELKREILEAQVERKPRHEEHEDAISNV